ncbi:diguanylate cyclase (GGDEF)-like protein [Sedimentibacter acidaminivorans]|uniref:Diguanylate cyclase (GGDEF)-like protein n=1 Tax=Sedimentibacter acidaminivorans TaxID=913099 RepID=A0ABS4GHY3_9FIRM|nr:diguanylate cyclase [Sedimentibacter acidaminivorans]MBP1927314.1 diguanylate cyclase (GGDEF)-like protein [Sedimentibacter acidaminivorans]
MEYPSINDFYLKFKAIYNEDGNFVDYILVYISETFNIATDIFPEELIGRKISDIVIYGGDKLCLKELYFNIIPKNSGKHEIYIKDLGRWYLVNIFTDKSLRSNSEETMMMYYSDMTSIINNTEYQLSHPGSLKNNIYYFKDIERLSCKDKLTGLYNKSFLDEEIARLDTKRQLPISVIMGDINGLKLINDAFGHSMGDNALKKSARIMMNSFRTEDIISRVGGDEFIIILPKTTEEIASSIVDRIKNKFENNPLDFIKLSISFGVATKEVASENIRDVLKKAEERMYFKKLKESKEAKLSMIKFLKKNLESITFETKAHYERLKKLSLMIANELGLSDIEKSKLNLLCEFHDIGKAGVSRVILQKEDTLNNEEWENVKRHSEIGYYIAKEFKDTLSVDELILVHHERWDGKGYPGLLKGEEIPIEARVFSIVDAYDAMVNDRPYKSRMSNQAALREISEKSGSQFDPNISKIFINLMENKEQIV